MHQVEISDTLYRAISARFSDVSAFVEQTAARALGEESGGRGTPRFDAAAVKAGLREFGQNFRGVSLDELRADCRLGRQ